MSLNWFLHVRPSPIKEFQTWVYFPLDDYWIYFSVFYLHPLYSHGQSITLIKDNRFRSPYIFSNSLFYFPYKCYRFLLFQRVFLSKLANHFAIWKCKVHASQVYIGMALIKVLNIKMLNVLVKAGRHHVHVH